MAIDSPREARQSPWRASPPTPARYSWGPSSSWPSWWALRTSARPVAHLCRERRPGLCPARGGALILGALCGILCERSGIINIGIEGMMLAGAFGAFVVKAFTGDLPSA